MASFKGFFKGIWKGLKVGGKTVATYGPIVSLIAPGSQAALVATIITNLVDRAEDKFPKAGSGKEKTSWVTVEGLKALELLTGKNYDSPQGRTLIQKLIDADVAIKNALAQVVGPLQVQYDDTVAAIQAYVESVSDPAIDDTEAA